MMMGIFSGKYKINARAFGGLGLLLIGLILIAPLWAGLLETGIVGDFPSNLIQIQEGVRSEFPTSQATVPDSHGNIISCIHIFIQSEKKTRQSIDLMPEITKRS